MKNRKWIDENGRLFGLISVIDVAVILVLVVTASAVYVKFNVLPITSTATPMDKITLTLTITNFPEGRLESLREGDLLYDNDNDTRVPIGTIESIQREDCYIPSTLLDGSYVMGHVEGRYNVVLTIEGEGIVDENGRTLFNRLNEAMVGMTINYYTKACYFAATITEITVHE